MEPKKTTENGVEETTDSSEEDLDFCDEDSVASSVDTTEEEMFMDGLDPILDLPSKETDSPENGRDSDVGLQQRKRPRLSPTSTSPKGGDERKRRSSSDASSIERWHSGDEVDVEPPPLLFAPLQTPGPTSKPNSCSSSLQFFQLFLSKSVMQAIVGHTNVYGTKCMDKIRRKWYYISLKDFKSFIALVIYMGVFKCSSLKDYWSESQYFKVPFPAQIMSYQNFLKISNTFYLSNTTEDEKNDTKKGTSSYERLGKIQRLYREMRDACRKCFHPFQNITINERMVISQARTGLEECLKNKSTNRGYKLFALSDCTCGYTWDFFIYEGKSSMSQSEGLSYESVMTLADENFLGTGYRLFLDKFYTSPALFRDLLHKKISACGPVRENRNSFPKTAVNRLPSNAPRGSMRWIRDDELLFVRWKDAQEVQMCSTFHKAYGGDTVQRKVKDNDGLRTLVDIPIPAAVLDYKRNMKAVDPSNCITGHYRMLHKPKKWYHSLFYHFLDIAVENAFIVQEQTAKAKNKAVLTRKAFLETLIVELTDIVRTESTTVCSALAFTANPSPAVSLSPSSAPPTGNSPVFHKPKYIAQDSTEGRRKCKHCHQKTPIMCVTCNVALCFQPKRDCFNGWHDKLIF